MVFLFCSECPPESSISRISMHHFLASTDWTTIQRQGIMVGGRRLAGCDSAAPGTSQAVGEHKPEEAADLIDLLEFEIGRIRSDQSRPGWTTWALVGSLATMAWLLTLQLQAHAISVPSVRFLLLVFSLVCDCLCFLFPALLQPKDSGRNSRFDFSHALFSSSRSSLLAQAAR